MIKRTKHIINRLLDRNHRRQNPSIDPQFAKMLRLVPTGQYDRDDVFIVGYPKSGNTWMQILIAGLVYGLDVRNVPIRLMLDLVPDINETYYRRYLTPTYFKSHNPPEANYRKVINIIRDGRDAMVSYYHFQRGLGQQSDWEDLVMNGTAYGLWHEHVEEWLKNPHAADIIYVKYENLLSQPLSEVGKICEFLQIDTSTAKLETVIEQASFKNMRSSEDKFGIGHTQFSDEHKFVRKGTIGAYKEEIPDDILIRMNEQMQTTLEKLDYPLS